MKCHFPDDGSPSLTRQSRQEGDGHVVTPAYINAPHCTPETRCYVPIVSQRAGTEVVPYEMQQPEGAEEGKGVCWVVSTQRGLQGPHARPVCSKQKTIN